MGAFCEPLSVLRNHPLGAASQGVCFFCQTDTLCSTDKHCVLHRPLNSPMCLPNRCHCYDTGFIRPQEQTPGVTGARLSATIAEALSRNSKYSAKYPPPRCNRFGYSIDLGETPRKVRLWQYTRALVLLSRSRLKSMPEFGTGRKWTLVDCSTTHTTKEEGTHTEVGAVDVVVTTAGLMLRHEHAEEMAGVE